MVKKTKVHAQVWVLKNVFYGTEAMNLLTACTLQEKLCLVKQKCDLKIYIQYTINIVSSSHSLLYLSTIF